MKNKLKSIHESILEEVKNLLEKNILLEVQSIEKVTVDSFDGYLACIELRGQDNFLLAISIEDALLRVIFNKFFNNTQETHIEDEHLLDGLKDELINIVAGLAIRNFPQNYNNIELGLPLALSKEKVFTLVDQKLCNSFKVTTKEGSLVCMLSRLS